MKRVMLYVLSIFILFFISGCNSSKMNSAGVEENPTFEEEEINYDIEQILFSKSFQSLDPNVEVISKNNKFRILASLGLSENSKVDIEKIIKKGNEVNIYVSGRTDKRNLRFAVPQVVLELKNFKPKNISDLKFNIVYKDYNHVKVKYSINDIINKVQSHFKVSLKGIPEYNLIREDKDIIWEIVYKSIFDKADPDTPLVNFTAKIDANKGVIISSEKVSISSSIDGGNILSYIPDKYLFYKKSIHDQDTNKTIEQLWSYDIKKDEKTMLYSSNFKISSVECSPDSKYLSLLEVNEGNTDLFVISLEDSKPYKVFIQENFKLHTFKWSEDNKLYLIGNKDKDYVYSYDVKKNVVGFVSDLSKNYDNLIIKDNQYILVEKSNEINKKITLTNNWELFRNIGHGFKPRFINVDLICFLQKDEKNDVNKLIIYNIKDREVVREINENILNYQILSSKELVLVVKNLNNQFMLIKYNIEEDSMTTITSIISEKVYLSEKNNRAYINISLPFENEKIEVIHELNLDEID